MSRGIGKVSTVGRSSKSRSQRWRIRLSKGLDLYVDRDGRPFYSKEHAESTLDLIRAEMHPDNFRFDPSFYKAKKDTPRLFSVWAEQWLNNCEIKMHRNQLSPTYIGSLRNYIQNLFIPFFGKMDMLEIRGFQINNFYMSLDYAPKSVWNIMAALHKLFNDARDQEIIQLVPKFPMAFKKSDLPESERKWADEETQDLIFQCLDPEAFFMIFFAATHGSRPGETRGLQHRDIDLKRDIVTIQRAWADSVLRPITKSKRVRHIPLDPLWKELYMSRPRNINPEAFVFCDKKGLPRGRNWCRNQWNEAVELAGVSPITLYEGTRHSIASQAVLRGVDLYAISKFLGHSNLEQTKAYAHLAVNPLRREQRKADVKQFGAKPVQMEK